MARPGRPASESYQPICCSISQSGSYSSETGIVALDDDDEPIFSISKSSMDVVMATGPAHKRDPTWTRMDLRRSSSTNTHSEQQAAILQQLHPHMWQQMSTTTSHQLALTAQNMDGPKPGSGQRWSACSRSSTPDTIVWRGGISRPSSLTQDMYYSPTPDSPMSTLCSPPTTPSPFTSPLNTPTLPPAGLLISDSTQARTQHQQDDSPVSQSAPSPSSPPSPPSPMHEQDPSPLQDQVPSPLQEQVSSPLEEQVFSLLQDQVSSPLQDQVSSALQDQVSSPLQEQVSSPLEEQVSSPLEEQVSPLLQDQVSSPLQDQVSSPIGAQNCSPLQSQNFSSQQEQELSPQEPLHFSPLEVQSNSPLQSQIFSLLPEQEFLTQEARNPSPLPLHSKSPNPVLLTSTEDESLTGDNVFTFQFPSPKPSSSGLAKEHTAAGCLVDDLIKQLQSPGHLQESDVREETGLEEETFSYMESPAAEQEPQRTQVSVCKLDLPWQPGEICPSLRGGRSPLVSSLSDSMLGECCRCNCREGTAKAVKIAEGHLIDAEVQTMSPIASWWDLKRTTFTCNMGSHSILGSPPGSRLNLKSSIGSNSNLVSPSSSMFPGNGSGGEDELRGEDPRWEAHSPSSNDLERRRSCLKIQSEERDELGRRSSMKQVQWDEDGMTWDIHGASVDPEVLSSAIQKHLENQNTPQPKRRSSKKKRAPKPPVISSMVKTMAPDQSPSGITGATPACTGEVEKKPEVEEKGGGKKEEGADLPRRISRAEGADGKNEEDEVYGEEGTHQRKSLSRTSSRQRSLIRSFRKTGWCGGGSRRTET